MDLEAIECVMALLTVAGTIAAPVIVVMWSPAFAESAESLRELTGEDDDEKCP